jgi:hypothetical protein
MPKSALYFISLADQGRFRDLVQRDDPGTWIRTLLLWWIRDHVFRVFQPRPDSSGIPAHIENAVQRLVMAQSVEALAQGVIAKLRRQHPRDSGRFSGA